MKNIIILIISLACGLTALADPYHFVTGSHALLKDGRILTVDASVAPNTISGDFRLLDPTEHFSITLRSDLSVDPSFDVVRGLMICFSNDSNVISIQEYLSPTDWSILAQTTIPLRTFKDYSFEITDDGSNVSLWLGGKDILSATTSFGLGTNVAFEDRGFVRGVAVSNVAVPDSSSTLAMVGAAAMGLFLVRRRFGKRV